MGDMAPQQSSLSPLGPRLAPVWHAIWRFTLKRVSIVIPSVLFTLLVSRLRMWRRMKKLYRGSMESLVICCLLHVDIAHLSHDGVIDKRTIFERSVNEVFRDPAMAEIVTNSIKHTHLVPRDDLSLEILSLPEQFRWIIYNAALNQISSMFAPWYFLGDTDAPVHKVWFLFALCVTQEIGRGRFFQSKDNRQVLPASLDHGAKKLKIFVIREETVRKIANNSACPPEDDVTPAGQGSRFQSERHKERYKILRKLAQLYEQGAMNVFMRFQVPLPIYKELPSSARSFVSGLKPVQSNPADLAGFPTKSY